MNAQQPATCLSDLHTTAEVGNLPRLVSPMTQLHCTAPQRRKQTANIHQAPAHQKQHPQRATGNMSRAVATDRQVRNQGDQTSALTRTSKGNNHMHGWSGQHAAKPLLHQATEQTCAHKATKHEACRGEPVYGPRTAVCSQQTGTYQPSNTSCGQAGKQRRQGDTIHSRQELPH